MTYLKLKLNQIRFLKAKIKVERHILSHKILNITIMKLLEQLKDLEHRKGLYSKEEYETKFKEITNAATDE